MPWSLLFVFNRTLRWYSELQAKFARADANEAEAYADRAKDRARFYESISDMLDRQGEHVRQKTIESGEDPWFDTTPPVVSRKVGV